MAKKRAAVPPRAPGPPSTSAGAPPPPPLAEPSATELRAASPAPSAPLSKEQALQQAAPPPRSLEEAEGLRLHLSSTNATGYKCVCHEPHSSQSRPYRVRAGDPRAGREGSLRVNLGNFATAVEAAVSYAQYVQSQQEAKQGEEEEEQQGGEQVGQQVESAEGAAGVPERSVDPSGRPIAAATRSSFATRPATADAAPCAADDSVEQHARRGSVRTSEEAQLCPLGVGQRVEAHYGVHEAELWWPAVVTKVRYHVRVRVRVRLW